MGLMENFGRVASTYMDEKDKLLVAGEKRQRERLGHAFWPHEVLRDALIFGAMMAVLLFYAWIIPPPLHGAADPYAQAGFVFPDWYVLFSYGYLRWGEYLPQFTVPTGFIGEIVGQPVFAWNAAWWGAALTGIPIGILVLPPFLGGREKRPVEDPWFASAGAVYLAHIWFISVFSINIFLDLYDKNRSDYCKLDSHGDLLCGVRAPWLAEVFNTIPWVMTGILLWIIIHFLARGFFVKAIGARLTPGGAKRIMMGALVVSAAFTVGTWEVYDKGFWGAQGLLTIDSYDELEAMRTQPTDVHPHDFNEFTDSQSYGEYTFSEAHIIPAAAFMQWEIYQPGNYMMMDFADENNHQNAEQGQNAATVSTNFAGSQGIFTQSGTMTITEDTTAFPEGHHHTITEIPADFLCSYRVSERLIDGEKALTMVSSSVTVTDSSGDVVVEFEDCAGAEFVYLPPGSYDWDFEVTTSGALANNDSVNVTAEMEFAAFQPLLLFSENAPDGLAGTTVDLTNETHTTLYGTYIGDVENPTYHTNPKKLDAKLTYAMFIPCLTLGALVFVVLRSMATGYEFEMNKCYGCDLCDDACPIRLFNGGDKLNIIYNTWNNEDDGVPLYSCLTCSACTNACPQLVDYDSYVDIRRTLIVGGPQAEIPHTVLQAVLAAEAEEDADEDFIAVEDYPITSNVGYYPGCVDYLDQEMVFSHVNDGEMNLGETTTAAFTLFEEMGQEVSYLGRDFLKCCGHDQKWQGLTEVFDKLKAYNQKKIEASGIDTLVSSCAECFRTFARDYELEGIKVMHTTEYLLENNFDMSLSTEDTTVTYHDPCRLGRQMGITEEPRELINQVEGVNLVEMEHHGEDAMCCGVSSMMSCNEDARALRVTRMEEIRATGASTMLTSCPKCVSHMECLKFEGDERYENIEILDVVSFLARQVNEKKAQVEASSLTTVEA